MAKKPVTPEQPFHYYGSTLYGWRCAETQQEVLAGLARHAGSDLVKRATKNHGGLEVMLYRIELPQSAQYLISDYRPTTITVDGEDTGRPVPKSFEGCFLVSTMKGNATLRPPHH